MIFKMNLKNVILVLIPLCALLMGGCFLYKETSTTVVYSSSKSKKDRLEVSVFSQSHCGCTDMFARKYEKGNLVYELYYGCNLFSPGKILYSYDESGHLIQTAKFKLTEDNNYATKLDSLDLFVLSKIDSFRTNQHPALPEYKLCKKNYQGFLRIQ